MDVDKSIANIEVYKNHFLIDDEANMNFFVHSAAHPFNPENLTIACTYEIDASSLSVLALKNKALFAEKHVCLEGGMPSSDVQILIRDSLEHIASNDLKQIILDAIHKSKIKDAIVYLKIDFICSVAKIEMFLQVVLSRTLLKFNDVILLSNIYVVGFNYEELA